MIPIFLSIAIFGMLAIMPFYLYRIVRGPDVFDRLIGLHGIATKTILFLILVGTYNGQLDMFIDICLGYALLNMVGSLAVGKYLERKGLRE